MNIDFIIVDAEPDGFHHVHREDGEVLNVQSDDPERDQKIIAFATNDSPGK
jgi:hypothetical protein